MIKLTHILKEIATDPTHHFTSLKRMANILKTNKFRLTNVIGTKSDVRHNRNKFFYLATQRGGHGKLGYAKYKNRVRIVLNGRKLSHNYKVVPVDYWQLPRDPKKATNYYDMMRNDEMEDRVISDKPEISPANKFIRRIDIYIDEPTDDIPETELKFLSVIDKNADRLNVDVYYFKENQKDEWDNMKISVATQDINDLIKNTDDEISTINPMIYPPTTLLELIYVIDRSVFEKMKQAILNDEHARREYDSNEYTTKSYDEYIEDRIDVSSAFNNYVSSVGALEYDAIQSVSSDISNMRRHNDSTSTKITKLLVRLMKKYNIRSVKELVKLGVKKAQQYFKERE